MPGKVVCAGAKQLSTSILILESYIVCRFFLVTSCQPPDWQLVKMSLITFGTLFLILCLQIVSVVKANGKLHQSKFPMITPSILHFI